MSDVYQCVIGQCGLKPYLPTNHSNQIINKLNYSNYGNN